MRSVRRSIYSLRRGQFVRIHSTGDFSFTTHAIIEAAEDELTGDDVLYVIQRGRIIEEYPERSRVLIYGRSLNQKPVHCIVEIDEELVKIVTVYIPSPSEWKKFSKRRKEQ